MAIEVRPVGKSFVARMLGVDVAAGIDDVTQERVEQALAEYGVVVFPDQALNDEQQQRFIARFGPPITTSLKELKSAKDTNPYFFDVGNLDDDGSRIGDNTPRGMYLLANQLWHTDGSQIQPPIRLTALSARVLPSSPPPTEYADMRAAYDALPEATRRRIDGMVAEHSILYSRSKIGMKAEDFSEETRKNRKPVLHPLVRTNARTGRKSLYLASHASHIVGLPLEEGRALIEELMAHATKPQFVYSHAWKARDLVMWDDSWTMHRATPFESNEQRLLRWCGVQEVAEV